MNATNLALFQWLTAGSQPTPWVLAVASAFALWSSWLCAGILALALWLHRPERAYLCIVAALAGLASLASHAIALSLNKPRPFMLGLAPSYIEHSGRGSLPSTHATVMFLLALAFLLRPGLRRLGVLLLVLAAVTGWARVYVGVHFPLDIAAGLLLACAITGVFAAAQWLVRHLLPFRASHAGRTRDDKTTATCFWRHP
ncbi:phosphatase PAP2 family protein [Variovorax sp. Root411]|uniref:phosphatase PAP2 family protein n=1 Tax=Variovorax sp. Root411 TaxID=1736530 RepID=UPI0006F704AB|nr:phosphatase PAP2 family protein [Variovorax sp. Root411]KQW65031.1 phosphoesterase PA-phosphatase [Variovorax sp. Root411]